MQFKNINRSVFAYCRCRLVGLSAALLWIVFTISSFIYQASSEAITATSGSSEFKQGKLAGHAPDASSRLIILEDYDSGEDDSNDENGIELISSTVEAQTTVANNVYTTWYKAAIFSHHGTPHIALYVLFQSWKSFLLNVLN